MGAAKQLGLVLWKNWILQKRRVCVTVFEILIPVFCACLFLVIRYLVASEEIANPTYYDPVNILDTGVNLMADTPVTVGYAPQSVITDRIINRTAILIERNRTGQIQFQPFDTEAHALESYKDNPKAMENIIVFYDVDSGSTSLPNDVRFAIRPASDSNNGWQTRRTYPFIQNGEPRDSYSRPYYESDGFLYLQKQVAEGLIQVLLKDNGKPEDTDVGAYLQRMPYPPYVKDPMIQVVQSYLPLFLVLSFIICVVINTKNLVYEKERKLKESMKLMGLTPTVYWMSWFITLLIYLIPAVILYALLLGVNIFPDKGAVLAKSNIFIFFLFLLCYTLSLISFCFMVSTFVQKANVAAALSGILFFGLYVPYWVIDSNYEDMTKSEKLGSCLIFNCAMGLGAKVIGIYEGTGEGAQFNNFSEPGSVDDNLSLLECMLFLLFDTAIHLLITWYLDNVRPGEFGVPKPFYFPFMKSYWCGKNRQKISDSYMEEADGQANRHFEKDPSNLKAGIQTKNLRKVFGHKTAVDGLTLNMYEGQISVLLGHNGAGKTTTMSMLTGFIPVTSGSAVVNGYDIREDLVGVRSSLGLCPQHNILFDTMTVREHLQFFAELKGAPKKGIENEIMSLVKELGIQEKLNANSMFLSGGQKRKLSVAIALIGGSKIVVLDEPSSGMDPAARRQTWTVLQKHRQGRTMLLTTHYMDEADVLGDRIAIMAEGVVKCCGSSMFLKKLYGAGYHLVVVQEPNCNVDKVTQLVKSHVSSSSLEGIINREITYLLPDNTSATFPGLFDEMESSKKSLGISSFGTSATTMEEVFLKVGDSGVDSDSTSSEELNSYGSVGYTNPSYTPDDGINGSPKTGQDKTPGRFEVAESGQDLMAFNKGFKKKTGLQLHFSQVKGLFIKKFLLTWRNLTITLVQLLIPVLFLILGLAVDELKPSSSKGPTLVFDLSPFGRTYIPYSAGENPAANDQNLASFYAGQFGGNQNLENVTLSSHFTFENYTLKRADELGTTSFNKKMIIGLEGKARRSHENISAKAYYNGQPLHAQPISINMMMNAFLRYFLDGTDYSLQTSIDPLPRSLEEDKKFAYNIGLFGGMSIGIFITFGMAFLTTLFIYYPIKEKQVGAKHMQIVSGVSPFTYWVPTFLWDFISYIIPSLLLLVVFAAYSKQAYVGDARSLLVILILILYGWSVLPFTYLLSFAFKEPPTGVVSIIMLNIFSGLATLIVVTVLQTPGLHTEDVADVLNWIFIIIFPNYNMAQSFVNMYSNYEYTDSCANTNCSIPRINPCCPGKCGSEVCVVYQENYLSFDKPGIGWYLFFMAVHGFLFFTLILLIEYNVFTKILYLIKSSPYNGSPEAHGFENSASSAEDSDVASERQRINSRPASVLSVNDPLLLVNLYKRFGNFVAVDHICVGVSEKECFGLLGQNGAGKTTTFKMLTGDEMVTGGNAYLKGFDVRNSIKDVQANMGYCPQFDALLDQMTGEETLTMYARLRGIPESNIPKVVDDLIQVLMLSPHRQKLAGNYSGGNKRKLSTAIALVGDPPFIMLDEPSAGMDPKARRQLWDVLSQVRASGRTLVLTSHSMEECDALCTRIAIMVNGSFVCLGSPQHLKNKFGQGYTLIIQLGTLPDGSIAHVEPVIDFIGQHFPGSRVFDSHEGYIHFQVPYANVSLSKVFSLMESTKTNLYVRDYSVQQTSLEQVFLSFTWAQQLPKESIKRDMCTKVLCCCCLGCGIMK